MLFPAIHKLGFQFGQAVANFLYTTAATMDQNNISAGTILAIVTDYDLLVETFKAGMDQVVK